VNPLRPSSQSPSQNRLPSGPAAGAARWTLDERVQHLLDFYRRVETERMQGIPILNPALSVEAVGFRVALNEAAVAEGVLITPWFMNLVRLPLSVEGHAGLVGRKRVHAFGTERFEFIGAHDPSLGFHESCALFSPMNDFGHQTLARETAQEVMTALTPLDTPPAPAPAVPARRAFLFGRSGVTQGRAS